MDRVNDLDLVEQTITQALAANRMVLKEPGPSTVVLELQEYAVLMKARAYVRSNDAWKAKWALQKEVQQALNKALILIPVSRQGGRGAQRVAGGCQPARGFPAIARFDSQIRMRMMAA